MIVCLASMKLGTKEHAVFKQTCTYTPAKREHYSPSSICLSNLFIPHVWVLLLKYHITCFIVHLRTIPLSEGLVSEPPCKAPQEGEETSGDKSL